MNVKIERIFEKSISKVLLMLDDVYSLFDQVCRNYGNLKIGTLGDAYIATGINYPVHRAAFEVNGDIAVSGNQAVQIAMMAREFLARIKTLNIPEIGHPVSVRIGIHKGNAPRIPILEHCS
jgi:class 3 adenylate cyclase